MDDQEFKTLADNSLTSLYNKLAAASDDAEFEVDFNSGALAIEFENPPAKFVISPNAPVRQIWVSARVKSFKQERCNMAGQFGAKSTTEEVLAGVSLKGKRILVTGVSAGLGVETARALVATGLIADGRRIPHIVLEGSQRMGVLANLVKICPGGESAL